MKVTNSFGARSLLRVGTAELEIYRLAALEREGVGAIRLPYAIRILLENLLRHEDGATVTATEIEALVNWPARGEPREIAFTPGRVLLHDFTGVPAVVDLAAMRAAVDRLSGDPSRVNPQVPTELVADHSVQVDYFGTHAAAEMNSDLDYARNRERYSLLRWGQKVFRDFLIIPPANGIVHQVNLEYLAQVVRRGPARTGSKHPTAYPDTLVGADSHTTMINGLGVLGWGVGGIEAEAAMLGQPLTMLVPEVLGFRMTGELPEGATATDLVLTITEILRRRGTVGKFVEFYGPGLAGLPVADRATIANMAPEYGATCALFPVDGEVLRYLGLTGRSPDKVALVEVYMKEQGLFHGPDSPDAHYADAIELDLGGVVPCLAGPRRPQDRVPLGEVRRSFHEALPEMRRRARPATAVQGSALDDGAVVIAAITSCTNTSNPSVMVAAGMLARNAVERGLRRKPWVKTSLAPGSRVVARYLAAAGLMPYLDALGFHVVGYGCATCVGHGGALPPAVSREITEQDLVVAAVLSGNRNFEGRIHPEVRANYLASPPLVVAYALVGRLDVGLLEEPLGNDGNGRPIFLRDIWPRSADVQALIWETIGPEMFRSEYANVLAGDDRWSSLPVQETELFRWDPASTYIRPAPFFDDIPAAAPPVTNIRGARVLAMLGDSITTDHISPVGTIPADSPAGCYLRERGVLPADFNSYGTRRGNHEVMMRGTFGSLRLRNRLVPGMEGGFTRHLPDGQPMTIFEAASSYGEEGVPLLVIAGKEYGTGSSRDWAAKGPRLLGVRAVIAESFERIHRSNLVGMGVLPLEFLPGQSGVSLGLDGSELYEVAGLAELEGAARDAGATASVRASRADGGRIEFEATIRLDTSREREYYRHGGILPFVLRQLLRPASAGSVVLAGG